MLNGVHLVDFGNHRNTRLTFGRMTALVGQNGSGKTTVMKGVEEVSLTCLRGALPGSQSGAQKLVRRTAGRAIITASWPDTRDDDVSDCGLHLSKTATWLSRMRMEPREDPVWIPSPNDTVPERPSRRFDGDELGPPGLVRFRWEPVRWTSRYFKTSASSLQNPAIVNPKETALSSDGSNLAWALSTLMTESPDVFQTIVGSLREVVPVVKRIRSRAVSLKQSVKQTISINDQDRVFEEEREVSGQELIFDMKSGDGLPATAVSEGTLVVLAVLTLVHGSDADLIMLDDVELGLHPKAQRDLIRQLRRIQETHPNLQILVSTHSPYVVDEFKPEDVWVFAPDKEGCAVTKRLSEHPDAKRALEVLSTGEFWSAEGEPWVLDEEPAARVAEEPAK